MKKEKYTAQALAMAMVVLVVSSILAISIYSRVSKDKTLSLDERNSAEALEVSDLILNYFTAAPIKSSIDALGGATALNTPGGITLTESSTKTEISNFLNNLSGVSNSFGNMNICPTSVADNTYFLNIQKADIDTYFEIRSGQILALPIKGISLPIEIGVCNTIIKVSVRGDNGAAFSVTKTYGNGYNAGLASKYKPYNEADVLHYCFASTTDTCNNQENLGDGLNWIKYADDNTENITLALNETVTFNSETYRLDEVKITAIGGTVGISYEIPTACTEELNMINVQAGANCSGTYRGKSVLIPEKQWESPIFNYVLFNGEGSL